MTTPDCSACSPSDICSSSEAACRLLRTLTALLASAARLLLSTDVEAALAVWRVPASGFAGTDDDVKLEGELTDASGRECCLDTAAASVADVDGVAVFWLMEDEAGLSEGPVTCDRGEGRKRGGVLLSLPLGLLSFGLQGTGRQYCCLLNLQLNRGHMHQTGCSTPE